MVIFFLLLLTRAFIPKDIQTIIQGSEFASNIYEYVPLKEVSLYPSLLNHFEFTFAPPTLEPFGIKYNSTIINTYTSFSFLIFMAVLHLCISLLKLLFLKWNNSNSKLVKGTNWLVVKLFNFMTFGYSIKLKLMKIWRLLFINKYKLLLILFYS